MISTRKFTASAIAVALTAALSAGALAQEPTTIRYFTFSAAPNYLDELDQMVAGFEQVNPDVKVEVESTTTSRSSRRRSPAAMRLTHSS